MQRKNVAVGVSKLLYFTLKNLPEIKFDYVLNITSSEKLYEGLEIKNYSVLQGENIEEIDFYIFAVSNHSICAIKNRLKEYNVNLEKQVFLYSDLFKNSFSEKINEVFLQKGNTELYDFAKNETLDSKLSVHTTICGSWLFLEALEHIKNIPGDIAEVGCFEGGNMLLGLKSGLIPDEKNVYLFDSFEGFPTLSVFDPAHLKSGDYKPEKSLEYIKSCFNAFKNVNIVPGYVPETFSKIPHDNKYSLIFFDCDLYQPCLDTLNYFWPKLSSGGLILIHDYFYEPGGFSGVEKATDEFSKAFDLEPFGIWESTMAILRKN